MTLKKNKEELRVRSIKNGSVIDHITAGNALNVLKILDIIGTTKAIVSVAMNVTSKRLPYGRKDIVKIEDRELIPTEAVSYTHLRAHETDSYLVCRLLLEKKKKQKH